MKIPFLDLKSNYLSIKDEVLAEINEVLETTGYILGPKVLSFEESFAKAHHVPFCIGVSSGTDANHLALWSLGIGPGDEVILPANTFIATAWGATLCGATPVFADCESGTYNLCAKSVEKSISPRTKAIVAVHLYGQPADMDTLQSLADSHNIPLIEDAAQAHLAEYKNNFVGGIGKIASFSFYPGKNLGAYGEGGAITTNDAELAHKAKLYREHGSSKKYYHQTLGHNYRMEAIQGAVLKVKMKYINQWTEKRRAIASLYKDLLKDEEQIILPFEAPYSKHVYHLFVIQSEERDLLMQHLNDNGVSTGLHYPVPLHLQECFKDLGYKNGQFPETEKIASKGLSLPMFPEMTVEQVEYVASQIKTFFRKK
jgi:dTDP-4-amino-4,6-dideoxygalactose transaminase